MLLRGVFIAALEAHGVPTMGINFHYDWNAHTFTTVRV